MRFIQHYLYIKDEIYRETGKYFRQDRGYKEITTTASNLPLHQCTFSHELKRTEI
jgi:hypothetical protein